MIPVKLHYDACLTHHCQVNDSSFQANSIAGESRAMGNQGTKVPKDSPVGGEEQETKAPKRGPTEEDLHGA